MGSLKDYAKRELSYLIESSEEYDNLIAENVLSLIDIFESQGHSGFSAPWCIRLFNRVASFKPIGPLTGEDNEWNEVGPDVYQNKRCSSIFKKGKDGRAYNIEAVIFSDDGGKSWFTNKSSTEYISFPYEVPDRPRRQIIRKDEVEKEDKEDL